MLWLGPKCLGFFPGGGDDRSLQPTNGDNGDTGPLKALQKPKLISNLHWKGYMKFYIFQLWQRENLCRLKCSISLNRFHSVPCKVYRQTALTHTRAVPKLGVYSRDRGKSNHLKWYRPPLIEFTTSQTAFYTIPTFFSRQLSISYINKVKKKKKNIYICQ